MTEFGKLVAKEKVKFPLFWCLKPDSQAALLQWQFDNYSEILKIPTPPTTSKGVWLAVEMESIEEIDKIMRQAPSHMKQVQ